MCIYIHTHVHILVPRLLHEYQQLGQETRNECCPFYRITAEPNIFVYRVTPRDARAQNTSTEPWEVFEIKLQKVNETYLGYWNSDCPTYNQTCPITNLSAPTGFTAVIDVLVCTGPVCLPHLLAGAGVLLILFFLMRN